jgi:ribose-phosphate pyrophosphokinase
MAATTQQIKVIIGNSNPDLFAKVVDHLKSTTTLPVTTLDKSAVIGKFSNGETRVDLGDNNMRGNIVYICQSEDNRPDFTVNDLFMEIVMLVDACRRADAYAINVIMPCFMYARQDKKNRPRVPISAKVVANILQAAGVDRLICVDLHSAQIGGFFDIANNNLYAAQYLHAELEECIRSTGLARDQFVLVSPDVGGAGRIQAYSSMMRLPSIVCGKQRNHAASSQVQSLHVYGDDDDIHGKIGIIVDDMIDTAGTIDALIAGLRAKGMAECWVAVTHGILSGPALERLAGNATLTRVICTNTIDQTQHAAALGSKFRLVDVSKLLADAVREIETCGSVSALFPGAKAI